MKVIIERDEEYPYYRLYEDIPKHKNYGEEYDVPLEVINEYNSLAKKWYDLQRKLELYWKDTQI
jgi:hypothetical protein